MKMSKKLFISIMSIALVAIALGTATYAWFTLGNTNTVQQVSANVAAQEGIEISLDNTTWYNNMSADVISNYMTANSVNNDLDALSLSSLSLDDGAFSFTKVDGEDGAGYLQLHFYVRYKGEIDSGKKADLYIKECQLDSTPISWTSDVTITDQDRDVYNITAGTSYNFYPSDAARVTFSNSATEDYLFTCQAYGHTVSSVYTAIDYGNNDDQINAYSGNGDGGFAKLYADKKNYSLANSIDNDINYMCVEVADEYTWVKNTTTGEVTCSTKIGDFTASEKLIDCFVTVWLDGWDDECINAILDGSLKLKLQFAVSDVYTPAPKNN